MRLRCLSFLCACVLFVAACSKETVTTFPPVFARGVSSDGSPIDILPKRIPVGVHQIYAVVKFEGLTANDVMTATWYHGTQKILENKTNPTQLMGGKAPQGRVSLWWPPDISFSTGAIPPGSYRLDVSLNGKVVQTGSFEVLP